MRRRRRRRRLVMFATFAAVVAATAQLRVVACIAPIDLDSATEYLAVRFGIVSTHEKNRGGRFGDARSSHAVSRAVIISAGAENVLRRLMLRQIACCPRCRRLVHDAATGWITPHVFRTVVISISVTGGREIGSKGSVSEVTGVL